MQKAAPFTSQIQQEQISRHQLAERLSQFGWISSPVMPDVGDDFNVHIYFQRSPTGVSFFVQEKSVTDLEKRRRRDYLVYDFEVKDLEKWESYNTPVTLIVWDINRREGRWELLPDVITNLDHRRPKWRSNKSTARVRIPWGNTTDDAGLIRLRAEIGRHFYPLIARGKSSPIEGFTVSFPNTEEGVQARSAFERMMGEGEPITIDGKFMPEVKLADWWTSWFGPYDRDTAELTFVPTPPAVTLSTNVDIVTSGQQTASLPNVELKVISWGTSVIRLSNKHTADPFHFDMTLYRRKQDLHTVNIKFKHLKDISLHLAEIALQFLQAMVEGGTLRLNFPNQHWMEFDIPPQVQMEPSLKYYIHLIGQLRAIQNMTHQRLDFPARDLTEQDIQAINLITTIIERGKTKENHPSASSECTKEQIEIILPISRRSKSFLQTADWDQHFVELFDSKILMGRMTEHITCKIETPANRLEEAVAILAPNEHFTLELMNVKVIRGFPDWFKREAERLAEQLTKDHGAESVYLFGSLAWGDSYGPETDIDLAVKGLSFKRFLEALSFVERESDYPVDLVDLDSIPLSLRERILSKGKLLSERETTTASGG